MAFLNQKKNNISWCQNVWNASFRACKTSISGTERCSPVAHCLWLPLHQPQTRRRPHAYSGKRRGANAPRDEGERGAWKSWPKAQRSENLGHGIWSHRFMANRWGNSGNWLTLIFWSPKSDGDRSHEIKRHVLLGRKVMTNLDSILKSRDIT